VRRVERSPFLALLAAAALSLASLAGCVAPSAKTPQSSGGVLDLRGYRFDLGESAPLSGQWDFIPASLDATLEDFAKPGIAQRRVPDLWNSDEAGGRGGKGYASYHLTVLLPPDAPKLAFHYLSCSTAFRIEVDGKEIVQVGVPSADPRSARAAYRPGFVRLGDLGDRMEIVVRVSNYAYRSGGMWYPLFLGESSAVEAKHHREFAVALAQATALFVMGAILLVLFGLRRKDRALLYNGLFAFVMTLRVLVTGEYILTDFWPSIPFELLVKLEYLTVSLSFPAATAFFAALFPDLVSRRLRRACIAPSLIYTAFVLVLPLDVLTRSLFVYYFFAGANIIVGVGALLARLMRRGGKEDLAIFIGGSILAASAINDALYSALVWWTGYLAPWGFGIFVFSQVFVLARRLTSEFAEAEELLSRKELLIKEIHHRVKNNLQVVASLLALQANRSADPAAKEVFAALRMRILSMSLVHEKLYGKSAAESIDLGSYIDDLVRLLVARDRLEAGKVSLKISAAPVDIDVDAGVDIGLVVTEIVSNAMKHALIPKGGGELRIESRAADGRISIVVEDDGPGFPTGFRPEEQDSMGYKLINSLLKKNSGSLEILEGPGGRVRIVLAS
jgi:two-component sensor histidine kinase